LRLPPLTVQASGIPVASTKRWCLEPFLARSTGLGPVAEPPFSPADGWSRRPPAPTRAHRRLVAPRAGSRAAAPTRLPAATHPSGGDRSSRPEAELSRQMPPRDPGGKHEQDPLQRLPVRQPLPARVAETPLDPRQERPDPRPQLVRHDPGRNGHRHPSKLDDRHRRPSPSANGSLHFGASSYSLSRGRLHTERTMSARACVSEMEPTGLEPVPFALPARRSPN
jgi:hypothetical protein